MTLLRNDLRSEDKGKQQSGWLDNIMPTKKGKEETEVAAKPRAIRETPKPVAPEAVPAPEPRAKLQPKPAPVPQTLASNPVRDERPTPDQGSFLPVSPVEESGLEKKVPILGVAAGVSFALLSLLSLLQGKEGLLGTLVLLTTGTIGASILGIWHRKQTQKAFWQGFAVFGLLYLTMAFVPLFPHESGLELPTARIARLVHAKVAGTPEDPRDSFAIMKGLPVMSPADSQPQAGADPVSASAPSQAQASFFALGDVRQFTVVGHCFFALVFAFLGSALSGWFYKSSLAI
jgi:hypothetical protein